MTEHELMVKRFRSDRIIFGRRERTERRLAAIDRALQLAANRNSNITDLYKLLQDAARVERFLLAGKT